MKKNKEDDDDNDNMIKLNKNQLDCLKEILSNISQKSTEKEIEKEVIPGKPLDE